MPTKNWCPENDRAWQMEQIEIEEASVVGENRRLRARLAEVEAQRNMLREYMEKLSCLGNGNRPGNSIGNSIAQEALAKLEEK